MRNTSINNYLKKFAHILPDGVGQYTLQVRTRQRAVVDRLRRSQIIGQPVSPLSDSRTGR
jgi:hypothetical protein